MNGCEKKKQIIHSKPELKINFGPEIWKFFMQMALNFCSESGDDTCL